MKKNRGTSERRSMPRFMGNLWLFIVLLLSLFPVYWIVITSFKPPHDIMATTPQFWPERPTLDNFTNLWTEPFLKFKKLTINSLIVTLGCTFLSVIVAIPAAFGLTRLRFPGRKLLGMSVFFVYLVPATLLFLPLYAIAALVGLQDTRLGLTLVYTSFNAPFCIWMIRSYIMSIPNELEESAMIDGCTRVGAWFRVILPLLAPGIAATAIFGFTLAWNEFLYAFVLTETAASRTMPVGLAGFIQLDTYQWGQLSAGAVVMALPVVLVYFFCQRYIVSGLTGGAVKG